MKLDSYSLVFYSQSDQFINDWLNRSINPLLKRSDKNVLSQLFLNYYISLLKEKGYRKLVFSQKSRDNLVNYVISKEIRFDVLRSLPNRKDVVMIDDVTCFKYRKTEKEVVILYYYKNYDSNHEDWIGVKYARFDLEENKVFGYEDSHIKDDTDMIYELFMKTITYIELTPVTLLIVNGGEKKGDILRNNLIKNESKLSVIQVNTNWNTRVIKVDSFKVRGHWRLQPCGKGRSQYKYIYIDMFEKGLLRRKSQKELQN